METGLSLAFGLVILYFAGEYLIDHASAFAKRLECSPFIIGSVILGFGSSLPELSVSLNAAWVNHGDIVIGNIIGSNIANMALVLPIAAFIFPVAVNGDIVKRDSLLMLIGTGIFCMLTYHFGMTRPIGLTFFLLLMLHLFMHYHYHKKNKSDHTIAPPLAYILLQLLKMSIALTGIVIGAHLFIHGAILLGQAFGISDAVIGLTVVAVGTALPEIVISVIAARQKHTELLIGNILGSNVFNMLGIGGITAMFIPIHTNTATLFSDYGMLFILSTVLTLMCFLASSITRLIGSILIIAYASYLFLLF